MQAYMKQTYLDQASQAISARESLINQFIEQGKWPKEGWDDLTVETFVHKLSLMDSNNFPHNVGVGEREARIGCDIVARRHFRLGHGIGRSGDLTEAQPKAAGSTLLNKLCNRLILDVIRECGVPNTKACFVTPMATGMSLTLCLLSLRSIRHSAKYVIWPRIDQKSCFKCIGTAGFEPLIIENIIENDCLKTDIAGLKKSIVELGADNIACILSTTSCFAPRVPDNLKEIAKLCKENGIPHIVNNAYGIQSSKCMHLIEEASRLGRIDAFVQSTDKNFMVPVGGAVIAGFDSEFINLISSTYPGRGSAGPSLDLIITLLHFGRNRFKQMLSDRKQTFIYLKEQLNRIAVRFGEKVLDTKDNTISIGMTVNCLNHSIGTQLGAMLFLRGVSGARVVSCQGTTKTINGHAFQSWCSHSDNYPHCYITAAAGIGVTCLEIDRFIAKLDDVLTKLSTTKINEKQS